MGKFTIKKIEAKAQQLGQEKLAQELIKRLYDFGFHPGLEIEVVQKVSFNSVTIVQFGNTRIALNAEEFACLHGH